MKPAPVPIDRPAAPGGPASEPGAQGAGPGATVWILLATEALFLSTLVAAYGLARYRWSAAFAMAARRIDWTDGALSTLALVSSSAVMALAVAWSRLADGRRLEPPYRGVLRLLLAGAGVLGVAVLALRLDEYSRLAQAGLLPGPGFRLVEAETPPPGAEQFFTAYFVMTALHGLHLLLALVALAWQAWRGPEPATMGPPPHDPLETLALYWHFMVTLWIVLFPLLYLVGR